MEIQKESGVDLTGVEKHGFKNLKSTASAGLIMQSILSLLCLLSSSSIATMTIIFLSFLPDISALKTNVKL